MHRPSGTSQYHDSRNLRKRGDLHARYASRSWFSWVADRIDLPVGGAVVDIGCGAGWFWSSAAERLPAGLRLTLVDRSEGMVAEARKHLSANTRFAEVAGKTADATALPFADRTFDAAVAMHMLYHVSDPEKATGEMARVMRPGGRVAVTTNSSGNLRELFEIGSAAFGGTACDPAAARLGPAAAAALLRTHFRDVTMLLFEDSYAIDDGDDVVRYLTSFPPGITATAGEREELRRLVLDRLRKSGGILRTNRECALIRAQKRR
jgi:SAM-dependent methyltransferase